MRIMFAAVAGLGLAAALAAAPAAAQQITFPAPVFRGGNGADWIVAMTTQPDYSVDYALTVPESRTPLRGKLQQKAASGMGDYLLVGKLGDGTAATGLSTKLAPVPLGRQCIDAKGKSTGRYGSYTYTVVLTPAKLGPWKVWKGCGNFTMK
ncbi:hypothetical protein [Lysobacter sp. ESA13C]|uniref:hypothetical protein n=1 Tax=unclassified Lysobacter TaxID=2635362 RepID=UPI001CBAF46C|nr:hypothetical protein [Lysobacter sp. ESA13C]